MAGIEREGVSFMDSKDDVVRLCGTTRCGDVVLIERKVVAIYDDRKRRIATIDFGPLSDALDDVRDDGWKPRPDSAVHGPWTEQRGDAG